MCITCTIGLPTGVGLGATSETLEVVTASIAAIFSDSILISALCIRIVPSGVSASCNGEYVFFGTRVVLHSEEVGGGGVKRGGVE